MNIPKHKIICWASSSFIPIIIIMVSFQNSSMQDRLQKDRNRNSSKHQIFRLRRWLNGLNLRISNLCCFHGFIIARMIMRV